MGCLCVFAVALALNSSAVVQGTSPNLAQASDVKPTPAHKVLPTSGAPPKTSAAQPTGPAVTNPPPTTSSQAIATETFSQLTLFLFGSGLALFVALLGWSDQIRGINKDTKDMEIRFLAMSGIDRADFLAVVKSTNPTEQLQAVANLIGSAQLTTVSAVELLSLFKEWKQRWGALERLSSKKYDLTIELTVSMFLAGVASLFTNASTRIPILSLSVRIEVLLLVVPLFIVAALIRILILASRQEKRFKQLLNAIEDKV